MSTNAIRDALEYLRDCEAYGPGARDILERAERGLAEVEAIERAAINLLTPQNPKEKAWALISDIKREASK